MDVRVCTWAEYKAAASRALSPPGQFVYRGQKNSDWKLSTSLQRTGLLINYDSFDYYLKNFLPHVQDVVQTWSGRTWNLSDQNSYAEFFAFLQHNGFPTPLLDWTYSPYVAAYFAFEALEHFQNLDGHVAIYQFNAAKWAGAFKQVNDISSRAPHVSLIQPRTMGNHKLMNQQGCFTLTNVVDIEEHLLLNQKDDTPYIQKFLISRKERPYAMAELALMGVSAVQLMPSIESVCKKAFEDISNKVLLQGLSAMQKESPGI